MLGDKLRYYMEANGYSQKELAKRSGCTQSAISYYLKCKRLPHLSILRRLASALGITVNELLDMGDQDVTGDGLILTFDGATGYFPKSFIIEAIQAYTKKGEWLKQSPDPEAMKIFHEKGLGTGMSVNSIFWTCSICENWGTPHHNYCSSCGAKMKGATNDNS